jgi:hypothetical protein
MGRRVLNTDTRGATRIRANKTIEIIYVFGAADRRNELLSVLGDLFFEFFLGPLAQLLHVIFYEQFHVVLRQEHQGRSDSTDKVNKVIIKYSKFHEPSLDDHRLTSSLLVQEFHFVAGVCQLLRVELEQVLHGHERLESQQELTLEDVVYKLVLNKIM